MPAPYITRDTAQELIAVMTLFNWDLTFIPSSASRIPKYLSEYRHCLGLFYLLTGWKLNALSMYYQFPFLHDKNPSLTSTKLHSYVFTINMNGSYQGIKLLFFIPYNFRSSIYNFEVVSSWVTMTKIIPSSDFTENKGHGDQINNTKDRMDYPLKKF